MARLLLLASRWFDARSLEELERCGWPRLSPAQSHVSAHVGEDGVPPRSWPAGWGARDRRPRPADGGG